VHANEIIVLDDGKIIERGAHEELLAQDGLYASMWNRQRVAAEAAEVLRETGETDAIGYLQREAISEKIPAE
jgi:ATP-binding cassette, subfamily B, heavy metal transporter